MIKNYKQFTEKYNVNPNDPTELSSDKNYFNKAEDDIKEFMSKKITIDNIYLTYSDENDLIAKLSAQKFITNDTSNKKDITFNNQLIGMYAQASKKKRELKSIEDELTMQNSNLKERQDMISANPDTTDSLKDDVVNIKSKIIDINKRITNIKDDISKLEKASNDKLREMQKTLQNSKRRLDYFANNKS